MAFRGRGRGRGRGGFGGGFGTAKQLPFELFPVIEALGTASDVKEAKTLAIWYSKFEKYCKSSPYYIEDVNDSSKKNLGTEIETYSNRDSEKNRPKARLSDFINMDPEYVPAELAKGDKKGKNVLKRVRWNPKSDTLNLDDLFTKKLHEYKSEQEKKKKEGEEENEDSGKEEEEEEYSENEYSENEVFDDDEDPYNEPEDNGDDEPLM